MVFVSKCLLCPSLQVQSDMIDGNIYCEIIKRILDAGVAIVQLDCPEASFDGYNVGLTRKPHGIHYYENLPGFKEHCTSLAEKTAKEIIGFHQNAFTVLAIIGIENSPTCAVHYIYTHQGMQKRRGLYFEAIDKILSSHNIVIPFLGINRRYTKKALRDINNLLDD